MPPFNETDTAEHIRTKELIRALRELRDQLLSGDHDEYFVETVGGICGEMVAYAFRCASKRVSK